MRNGIKAKSPPQAGTFVLIIAQGFTRNYYTSRFHFAQNLQGVMNA